jgi:hypothetical protein
MLLKSDLLLLAAFAGLTATAAVVPVPATLS